MALPSDVTTCTITFGGPGFVDVEGDVDFVGLTGWLRPTVAGRPLARPVLHVETLQEITPTRVPITIGADGTAEITVPHTDLAVLDPVDFTYTVTWDVQTGGPTPGDKTFSLPASIGSTFAYSLLEISDVEGVSVPVQGANNAAVAEYLVGPGPTADALAALLLAATDPLAAKAYVDSLVAPLVADLANANSTGGASTLVRRSSGGGGTIVAARVSVSTTTPQSNNELTRKDYVDALGTNLSTSDTVARRDVNGVSQFQQVSLQAGTPTAATHATRKDYVDGLVAANSALIAANGALASLGGLTTAVGRYSTPVILTGSTLVLNQDGVLLWPLTTTRPITIDLLGLRVQVAGDGTMRYGLYPDADGVPGGAPLVDVLAAFSANIAIGTYDVTLPTPYALPPGRYWLAVGCTGVVTAAPTVRAGALVRDQVPITAAQAAAAPAVAALRVVGWTNPAALPSGPFTFDNTGPITAPRLYFRRSA